ncbi:MAG: PAS domain-containing sensor histidine kinase [Lautropia sp.]
MSRYLVEPTGSYWRSLRHLADARVVVALLLLAYVPLLSRQGEGVDGGFERALFLQTAWAYVGASIACSIAVRGVGRRFLGVAFARHGFTTRGFNLLLFSQIVIDIVAIALIVKAAGGAKSGLGVLMMMPAAGAAILSTPVFALFIAAAASLALLGESGLRLLGEWSRGSGRDGDFGELLTAASISAGLFMLVAIVNLLARRLAAQEALAIQRGADLRNQLSINQLVIAELDQGVVVVDARGAVKTLNPKAIRSLGTPGSDGAQRAFKTLRALIASGKQVADLSIAGPDRGPRRYRARVLEVRAADGAGPDGADRVILLEDLALVEERAQQLKLASMGRMSASIAHEIRNPLGAIRHAGGLLAEQVSEPGPRRLTQIIEQNSLRIDRIVEDVLSISRRAASIEPVALAPFFEHFLPEFIAQSGESRDRIALRLDSREPIQFDPNHLRQVLVNLLGNALRYASEASGAILIRWSVDADPERPGSTRALLRLYDDGPGVPASDRDSLFEPFFTTETRGTGLGLHLAQELCAASGAQLRYERLPAERYSGVFVIEPRRAASAAPQPTGAKGWRQKQAA